MSPAADYAAMAILMLVCALLFAAAGFGAWFTGRESLAVLGGLVALACIVIGCRCARQCRNLSL